MARPPRRMACYGVVAPNATAPSVDADKHSSWSESPVSDAQRIKRIKRDPMTSVICPRQQDGRDHRSPASEAVGVDPFHKVPFSNEEPAVREPGDAPIASLRPLLSRLPQAAQTSPAHHGVEVDAPTVTYTESTLPAIDLASWHLHDALHALRPTSAAYAHEPYRRAFNWSEIKLPVEIEREWYIVAFRSQRDMTETGTDLYDADRAAHEEAVAAGGLLLYWYGAPSAEGANLATCIWQSRKAALEAMRQPLHVNAMTLASRMYTSYTLERWILRKRRGRRELELVPYEAGDVGF